MGCPRSSEKRRGGTGWVSAKRGVEIDHDSIGIEDSGISLTPDGVPGSEVAGVSCRDDPAVRVIDRVGVVTSHGQSEPAATGRALPACIEAADDVWRVHHESDPAAEAEFDVGFVGGLDWDVEAQRAIERKGCGHIVDDEAEPIESWCHLFLREQLGAQPIGFPERVRLVAIRSHVTRR